MRIIEAINRIDSLKHNTYTQPEKIAWLSTLDSMAKAHVIDTHVGGENVTFNGYDQNTDLNTVLLIPAPYEEAYLKWLEAQIDYANGEYDKYNNAIESFNTFWNGYKNYYNRTHMPIRNHVRFFGGHPKPNSGSPQVNQAAIERILTKIGDMNKLNTENKETLVAAINEALRGGADREEIKRIVDEYLKEHGTGGTVKTVNGIAPDENGNVQIPGSGGNANLSGTEKNLILTLFRNAAYISDGMGAVLAQLESLWSGGGEVEPDEPDTEKTLRSISATYSGGDVAVGTAVSELTGIVVTAHYSDGTSEAVTGYTLSGMIAEGSNTITVSYGGMTTTFAVTGTAESGGEESGLAQYEYELTNTGKLCTADGGLTNHGVYNTTDFIEVDASTTTLTVAYAEGVKKIAYVQFFNEDTFIHRTQTGYEEQTHTLDIPSEATKFRVSVIAGYDFAIYKGTVTADQI